MTQERSQDGTTFDPAIQSENIAFKPTEMVACERCARQNPPNRTNCIYCGGTLAVEIEIGHLKTAYRKLESWERGWNVIVTRATGGDLGTVSSELDLSLDLQKNIAAANVPLPLARVDSEQVALFLSQKLIDHGIDALTLGDDELDPATPPVRLRSIEMSDKGPTLVDFNTGHVKHVDWADVALLVSGQLVSTRTDAVEKRRRRTKAAKQLDSVEAATDETVLDLYTRQDPIGYRIQSSGFDFSCLGDNKQMLASQNMAKLAAELQSHVPSLRYVDEYRSVRKLLDDIWERESRQDPQGLVRSGFGRKEFGRTFSSNNFQQFLKFSRLQWHLL